VARRFNWGAPGFRLATVFPALQTKLGLRQRSTAQDLKVAFQKNLLRSSKADPRQYVLIPELPLHKLEILFKPFLPGKFPGTQISPEFLQKRH
jgi:hypothetical protein